MTAFFPLLVACWVGLCAFLSGAGMTFAADLPYAGACELTWDGGLLYRGTCAIRRAPIPQLGTGATCLGELISLRIPGRGGADLLHGTGPGCASDFLGSPVTFIAEDAQGWRVVVTEAGKIFRFDPGPDPALPPLEPLLAGLDRCSPTPQLRAFVQDLRARFPDAARAPEGPLASDGLPLPFPPGGLIVPEQITARKRGPDLQIDLQLAGRYLGLSVVGLRTSFGADGTLRAQELVFAAPRNAVRVRLGPVRDLAERPRKAATGGPYLAPGTPTTLVCRFAP